ncbi:hypothetical protein [Streptomyces sp. NPDC101166]|uniref:hypothetical protein n=1 Tax=Streptomyces sp. NPDC101166 TaxID=3366120 RepID=UPI0038295818
MSSVGPPVVHVRLKVSATPGTHHAMLTWPRGERTGFREAEIREDGGGEGMCADLLAAVAQGEKALALEQDGPPAAHEDGTELSTPPGCTPSGLVVLQIKSPELEEIDWEELFQQAGRVHGRLWRLVRSRLGPGSFQPDAPAVFPDLPVRVMVLGVDPSVRPGGGVSGHEDIAAHYALRDKVPWWEVDVLPGRLNRETLLPRLRHVQPHILHLAGSAAEELLTDDTLDLGELNLSHTRLVVSTGPVRTPEARGRLDAFLRSDAQDPVLGVVSLALRNPKAPEDCRLCAPVSAFYRTLAEDGALDEAARSAVRNAPELRAVTTVNCHPGLVLPRRTPEPGAEARIGRSLYDDLHHGADRVAQRRQALDVLQDGASVKRLVAVHGPRAHGEPLRGAPSGTTHVLKSVLRAWEAGGGIALYVDLHRHEDGLSDGELRPPPDPYVETVAQLAESVARDHLAHDEEIERQLVGLRERIDEWRRRHERGDGRTVLKVHAEDVFSAGRELMVKIAPPGSHVVLAIDHFEEADDAVAGQLVRNLFDKILASASLSIVAATRNGADVRWLRLFCTTPFDIHCENWPADFAGPLFREIGARNGIDWHRTPEWRSTVKELADGDGREVGVDLLATAGRVARRTQSGGRS